MVVIGNAASGEDISRELARVAKDVHLSGRTWSSNVDFSEPLGEHKNLWRHSTVIIPCVSKCSWTSKRFWYSNLVQVWNVVVFDVEEDGLACR